MIYKEKLVDIKSILDFSDKTYDRLKWIVQIVLPAIGTLYFAIASSWGLPNPEAVVGTIMAVDLFLGVVLGISTKQYENSEDSYDGKIVITETPEKKLMSLEFGDQDPYDLDTKNSVTLKVESSVPDVAGEDISGPRPPEH